MAFRFMYFLVLQSFHVPFTSLATQEKRRGWAERIEMESARNRNDIEVKAQWDRSEIKVKSK